MILNQTFVLWNSLHQHCIVSPFRLSFPSISCALLYSKTPHITTTVPRPDKNVTGFPNRRTDSHISRARFPVLATLQKVSFVIQNIIFDRSMDIKHMVGNNILCDFELTCELPGIWNPLIHRRLWFENGKRLHWLGIEVPYGQCILDPIFPCLPT